MVLLYLVGELPLNGRKAADVLVVVLVVLVVAVEVEEEEAVVIPMLASAVAEKATGLVIAPNPLATVVDQAAVAVVVVEVEVEAGEAARLLLAEAAPTPVLAQDLHARGLPGRADPPERTGPSPESETGQRGRRGPSPVRGTERETSPHPEAPGRDHEADLVPARAKSVPLRPLLSAQDLLRLRPRGMRPKRMEIMPSDMRTETRRDPREMIRKA